DAPKATEPRGDTDGPRRGSLCDRHCTINTLQGDPGDTGCHLHRPRLPPAVCTPSCCQQHSEEVCESCLVKTTLTAENVVEANKLSNNYKFGFKKWKSHVTERPWEDRSEIVKELYSDLNVIRGSGGGWLWGHPGWWQRGLGVIMAPACVSPPPGSTVTCGNVLYLLLFGWWLSLLYVLVAALMFVTIVGAPYGQLCWDLAGYFLWPFGKVIQKVEVPKPCRTQDTSEAGKGESSALLGGPVPRRWRPRCWQDAGYWEGAGTVVWLSLGYPALAVAHGLICVTSWLLIILIPVAKLSAHTLTRVLPLPPERVLVRRLRMTEAPLEGEVLLCCHRAANPYYYKYTVDGINVFAANLLVLVLVTLVLGYVDSHNLLTSSSIKFSLALLSIMPLSYYIGMAIARAPLPRAWNLLLTPHPAESCAHGSAPLSGCSAPAQQPQGSQPFLIPAPSSSSQPLLGSLQYLPGLCMVIGGIRHQEQRFNSRSAGVSSALLFLSVGGVFAPTLFSKVYGKLVCGECHNVTHNPLGHYLCHNCHFDLMGSNGTLYYSHVQPLVYTVSLLLPAAYLVGLFFTLKTHSHIYDIHISDCHMPGHHHSAVVHWSRWRALVILLLSTLCMSACADLATEHISPILTNSTISQYFIGVTVLAMVPELPEIVNGIQFALQNNLSLSIEIGNCIAVQVCMLQIPILVLFTIFYPTNFTLVFSDLHVYASMFSVVLINYTFMDGKCDYFQG
ncbi:VNX1 protein, partial [Alcedo cyanopectus]|nr:VNX1 protein [Ceyx cyanopectus]